MQRDLSKRPELCCVNKSDSTIHPSQTESIKLTPVLFGLDQKAFWEMKESANRYRISR